MNPIWFIPAVTLVLLSAIIGYRMGQPMPESAAIDRAATVYVRDFDGALTDCVGAPASDPAYLLVVVCSSATGETVRYQVTRRGGVHQTALQSEART